MNRAIQYYAMIKSGWLPDNIKDTFYPFFITLLYHEVNTYRMEDLSLKFEEKYGFNISHFILSYLLERAIKDSYVNIENDRIIILRDQLDKKLLIDEVKVDIENAKIIDFLQSFVKSCNETEINLDKAFEILDLFLKRYDFNIISSTLDFSEDEQNVFMYFFIDYVRNIHRNNTQQYNTLVSICEGNMIRSMLLNDNIEINNIYKGQCIFLDTPVVLQVLGFCGEYLEKEYKFLVSSWIKQGANVYIFRHTLLEIDEVLQTAERYVESIDVDISRSSKVLLYFRELRYKRSDVRQIIVKLSDLIKNNQISIYEDVEIDDRYSENEEEIKSSIIEQYQKNRRYERDYESATFIDYDVKSIWNTYMLRKDNQVRKISESKALFITNNRGIIAAVNNYHNKYYKFSLSPVIRDTYIGMLVVANNLNTTTDYVSRNLIAICSSAYKPTTAIKQSYIKEVTELRKKSSITEDDYILLKNYPEVSDLLSQKTLGFTEDLSDTVIFEVLGSIKIKMIEHEKTTMQEELKSKDLKNSKDLEEVRIQSTLQIAESESKNKQDRINYACNDYKKIRLKILITYYSFYGILLIATIYMWVDKILNELYRENMFFIIVLSGIVTVYTIIVIIEQATQKSVFVKSILKKKKIKLSKYYKVDIEEIENK